MHIPANVYIRHAVIGRRLILTTHASHTRVEGAFEKCHGLNAGGFPSLVPFPLIFSFDLGPAFRQPFHRTFLLRTREFPTPNCLLRYAGYAEKNYHIRLRPSVPVQDGIHTLTSNGMVIETHGTYHKTCRKK